MKFVQRIWLAIVSLSVAVLSSCGTLPEKPRHIGPQSEHSHIPWNTPQAGEGEGFLGGFGQGR